METVREFRTDQTKYALPEDKIEPFKETYPDAVELQTYRNGTNTYKLPVSEVTGFQKQYPDAERIHVYRDDKGLLNVPDSQNETFVRQAFPQQAAPVEAPPQQKNIPGVQSSESMSPPSPSPQVAIQNTPDEPIQTHALDPQIAATEKLLAMLTRYRNAGVMPARAEKTGILENVWDALTISADDAAAKYAPQGTQPWDAQEEKRYYDLQDLLRELNRVKSDPTPIERVGNAAMTAAIPGWNWQGAKPTGPADYIADFTGGLVGTLYSYLPFTKAANALTSSSLLANIGTFVTHGQVYMDANTPISGRLSKAAKDTAVAGAFTAIGLLEELTPILGEARKRGNLPTWMESADVRDAISTTAKYGIKPAGLLALGAALPGEGASKMDRAVSAATVLFMEYLPRMSQIDARRKLREQMEKEFGEGNAKKIMHEMREVTYMKPDELHEARIKANKIADGLKKDIQARQQATDTQRQQMIADARSPDPARKAAAKEWLRTNIVGAPPTEAGAMQQRPQAPPAAAVTTPPAPMPEVASPTLALPQGPQYNLPPGPVRMRPVVPGAEPVARNATTLENLASQTGIPEVTIAKLPAEDQIRMLNDPGYAQEKSAEWLAANQEPAPESFQPLEKPVQKVPTIGKIEGKNLQTLETIQQQLPQAESAEARQVIPAPATIEPPQETPAMIETPPSEPPPRAADTEIGMPPAKFPVMRVNPKKVEFRPEMMQYKHIDDAKTGINAEDKIEGKWDETKGGLMLLWEPTNPQSHGLAPGSKYIVANGHHRMVRALEDSIPAVNVQVLREADGWSHVDARRKAAEINITDGKGSIYDQANWFRDTAATLGADAAMEEGRAVGARGRKAFAIGTMAGDNLYTAFINQTVGADATETIAKTAPNNDDVQRIGMKAAWRGLKGNELSNYMLAVMQETGSSRPTAQQQVLFGEDDTAIKEMETRAARATKIQNAITENVRVLNQAIKRGGKLELTSQQASKLGIDDRKDDQQIQSALDELVNEQERWKHWSLHPDLVARIKDGDNAGSTLPKTTPTPVLAPEDTAPPPTLFGAVEPQADLPRVDAETVPGEKPVPAKTKEDLIADIYSYQTSYYDKRTKKWVYTDRNQITKAIDKANEQGVRVEHKPSLGRGEAESWQIYNDDLKKAYQLTRDPNGRTVWLAGKYKEPPTTPAQATPAKPVAKAELQNTPPEQAISAQQDKQPEVGDLGGQQGGKTLEEWKAANGITAAPEQGEMFGKGAVGDLYDLKQETAPDNARIIERNAQQAEARKEAAKAQDLLFEGTEETFKTITDLRAKFGQVPMAEIEGEKGSYRLKRNGEDTGKIKENAVRYSLENKNVGPEKIDEAVKEQLDWIETISKAGTMPYQSIAESPSDNVDRTGSAPLQDRKRIIAKAFKELSIGSSRTLNKDAVSAAFETEGDTISVILKDQLTVNHNLALPVNGLKVKSPRDVMALMMQMRSPWQESFKVLYLDANNNVISAKVATVGLIDASLVNPQVVFGQSPQNTASVIVSHNHPSGDPTPSQADLDVSNALADAANELGINLVDHVITDDWKYVSLQAVGMISFKNNDVKNYSLEKPTEMAWTSELAAWGAVDRAKLAKIHDAATAKHIFDMLRETNPNHCHVVGLNAKNGITSIHRFTLNDFADNKEKLIKTIMGEPINAVLLDIPAPTASAAKITESLKTHLEPLKIQVLDCIDKDRNSLVELGLVAAVQEPAPPLMYGSGENPLQVKESNGKYITSPAEERKTMNLASKALDEIQKVWAPGNRGEQAIATKQILLKRISEADRAKEVAYKALEKAMWSMAFSRRADRWQFIDDVENGRPIFKSQWNSIGNKLREMLDAKRDEVRAISPSALKSFYENYFPHLWKNPNGVVDIMQQILSTRPLKGPASFLKQRTYMTFKEGLEAGLEPVTENPIEMVLLKLAEMDKYIMAHKVVDDLKVKGMSKFVYIKSRAPEGYFPLNDDIFKVILPPELTIHEAYDEILMTGLSRVARGLGVDVKTATKMRGSTWGTASRDGQVKRRFAGPESVLAHEIGHQLGFKYDLFNYLRQTGHGEYREVTRGPNQGQRRFFPDKDAVKHRSIIDKEWRALADARAEDKDVSEHFKKYLRKKEEKEAVLLEAYIHAPDKFKDIAPTLYNEFDSFLRSHPETEELAEMRPALVLGTNTGQIEIPGITQVGQYYAPEPVAKLLNNHLSPGLRKYKGYDLARRAGNLLNQSQLLVAAFHASNVTLDTMSSYVGLGLREALATGEPIKAAKHIAMGLTGAAPIKALYRGRKIIKQYRSENVDPQYQKILEAFEAAGGHVSMDPYYYNQAIRSLVADIQKAREADGVKKLGYGAKIVFDLGGSVLELLNKPIMEVLVPTMKVGLFDELAGHEMARAEKLGLSESQTTERIISIWRSADNRLGQLHYDNLFWDRTLKDSLMLGFRSVGWNAGTIGEYGGSAVDVANTWERVKKGDAWLSQKMGYVMGAIIVNTILGSIYYYLRFGKAPWEDEKFQGVKDIVFPRTGKIRPDGSQDRVSFPTYMKDIYAWATSPGKTLGHKLHPLWSVVADILQNEDFYGVEIAAKGDPWWKQRLSQAGYVGKQFVPFSVRNYQQQREAGATKLDAAQTFIGITPAPGNITRTKTHSLILSMNALHMQQGSRNKEDFERSKRRKEIIKSLRAGENPVTFEDIQQYSPAGIRAMHREARLTPMQASYSRLSMADMVLVYAQADEADRKELRPILTMRYQGYTPQQLLRQPVRLREAYSKARGLLLNEHQNSTK